MVKRSVLWVPLAAALSFAGVAANAQPTSLQPGPDVLNPTPPDEAYAGRVQGVVYVKFRPGYIPNAESIASSINGGDPVKRILREIDARSIELFDKTAWRDPISQSVGIDRIYVIYYNSNAHPLGVVTKLLQTGLVESASPRYIFKLQSKPNDPGFNSQYYMQKIQAEAAWDQTEGDSTIVIADVDAGVNYNHEDLAANIKYNAGEIGTDAQGHDKRSNGIDDDGDGAVDNWRGWDTAGETVGNQPISPDNDPYPEDIQWHGANHGTLTSGCFGAVTNNSIGLAGVAPKSKILAIKIGNAQEQLTGAYEGIHYAAAHGAKVINCSWGGLVDRDAIPFMKTFTDEISARGEVMVAAAGNYTINNDLQHFYPAFIPDVLAVGATGSTDQVTSFSHFGHSVDVFAPGQGINSTDYPGGSAYNEVDGTSFSSPITAGVVALVMAKFPGLSPKQVQKRIIETCDDVLGRDRWLYWGRVNALNALISPGHPGLEIVALNVQGGGNLDKVDAASNVSVYFKNFAALGTNIFATLQPGQGYTWDNFDPIHSGTWPRKLVGTIDSFATASTKFDIIRTGQISEGSITLTFYVLDGSGYSDTLRVTVPVTEKDGMKMRMPSPHATCVRQVNASSAWAGFGYYFSARDPETHTDSTILVSQFSKRKSDGSWSAPEDIEAGDKPVYTVDAIDGKHAWFGAASPTGSQNVILYTDDGAQSWMSTNVSQPVRWIHFFDKDNGIYGSDASGTKFQMYTTTDGGASWTAGGNASAPVSGEASFYNAAFWNGDRGWFGTSNREVFFTTDRGASWHSSSTWTGATAKEKNVMSVAFASDNNVGLAAIRGAGAAADSAGLYMSQNGGVTWTALTKPDAGLIPYAVSFMPGTTVGLVTTNMGVYKITSPTAKWTFLGVPSSWDPRYSTISAQGTATAYTISAGSDASGIVDYAVGSAGVSERPSGTQFSLQNAPNPVHDNTTIYFTLPRAEKINVEVRDILGRQVDDVFSGSMSEGEHAIPVSTGQLTPGVYTVSVRTESGLGAEHKMVVVR